MNVLKLENILIDDEYEPKLKSIHCKIFIDDKYVLDMVRDVEKLNREEYQIPYYSGGLFYELKKEDIEMKDATLMVHDCGCKFCDDIEVKIKVNENTVEFIDLTNEKEGVDYSSLNYFVFDKKQYYEEIERAEFENEFLEEIFYAHRDLLL